VYSIELYANSAIPRWRTSITDNYDEQLHTLLNRKRLSRGHKNSKQIHVDSDNCDSTRLTSNSLQTTKGNRGSTRLPEKNKRNWVVIRCQQLQHLSH